MLGVYLAAAELTNHELIVSPTSRNAFGADLLVTDGHCRKAWSVQVKTNRKAANFWLLNSHVAGSRSKSHVYIFVNLKGDSRPDYYVVPSADVVRLHGVNTARTGSVWHYISEKKLGAFKEAWERVFR